MSVRQLECVVVGGGILGLSVACRLLQREPGLRLALLEKEPGLAAHQTGRNSGVIHSGIYYKPGSLKARLSRAGTRQLIELCREHGLAFEICGKVIVATNEAEVPRLQALRERGRQNGLHVSWLSAEEVREREPHVRCVAGVHVPETGIVGYASVVETLARLVRAAGGEIRLGTKVRSAVRQSRGFTVETDAGAVETGFLVNCAGLHCDRVAALAGAPQEARIVPFRGEYYELIPSRSHLVRALIYPVPDPAFPFLGVHFTRMIDGSIHAGPNAVLAFGREAYARSDFNLRDLWETATFPGFWALARRHWRDGLREVYRSWSKPEFARSLQRLIPAVREEDLVPSAAGVRAQALQPDGRMVDDFLLVQDERVLHVLNAPSPAATASLAIADHVVAQLPELSSRA